MKAQGAVCNELRKQKKKDLGRNYETWFSSVTPVCILKLAGTTGNMKGYGLFVL
jgi:hypothetical protein